MKATTSPIYRWHVGEIEITRVLEFEAALFEPAVIHPEAIPEIIERLGGVEPRAGAARLGSGADQPRQRALETRGTRERGGAAGGSD